MLLSIFRLQLSQNGINRLVYFLFIDDNLQYITSSSIQNIYIYIEILFLMFIIIKIEKVPIYRYFFYCF